VTQPATHARGQSRPDRPARNVGSVVWLDARRSPEFQAWFREAFAAWLREAYQNRAETVAAAFGVRTSTAYAWLNAENRASGDAVARVFMTDPNAAAWFVAQGKKVAA